MAISVEVSKKVILKYNDGQYTFSRFDPQSNDQKCYNLALGLNSFQSVQPPKEILLVTKEQII